MGTDSDKELGPNSIEGGGPECKAEQRKKPQAFFSFSGGKKEDQRTSYSMASSSFTGHLFFVVWLMLLPFGLLNSLETFSLAEKKVPSLSVWLAAVQAYKL